MFTKKKIAYALGGGGAYGFAHIGALKYLESMNIYPSAICGTSIGALIGGLYAFGMNASEIENITKELNIIKIMDLFINPGILKGGLIDTEKIRDFLYTYIGDVHISELSIPFVAVACDNESAQEVYMYNCLLIDAILASISIPALFIPYNYNNSFLVDGGVVNNFPVNIASHFSKYVIGINVLPLLLKGNINQDKQINMLVHDIKKCRKNFALNTILDNKESISVKEEHSKIEHIKEVIENYKENLSFDKTKFTFFDTFIKLNRIVAQSQYNTIKNRRNSLIVNIDGLEDYNFSDFHKSNDIIDIGYNIMKGYNYRLKKFI